MEKRLHRAVNVEVIDEAFFMPQLQRERRIWVYKPANYYRTSKRYPVIYMQDGQNLFDEDAAFDHEWGIDETLNDMHAGCIVVGVDNGPQRLTEYNFSDSTKHGKGEGRQYIRFIVDTLKPTIDLNFRTLPQQPATHIAGSSMGGNVSLFGALAYPEVFGGAGVFSPALWMSPGFADDLRAMAVANTAYQQRLYCYGGAQEGSSMVENLTRAVDVLNVFKKYILYMEVDPEGVHSENCWREKFSDYYRWMFGAGNGMPDGQRSSGD